MMNLTKTLVLTSVAVALAAAPASAGILSIDASVGGAPQFANRVNFDNLALGNAGGAADGVVSVAFTGDAQLVQGGLSGQYAAPFLSGGNGNGFGPGGSNQANGVDTTNYITSGRTPSTVTLTFASAQQFFGLLWGSVDDYNTLTFYNGASLVGTVTGAQVIGLPNGNQGEQGTVYVNINADPFTSVVLTSTSYAFEIDNVSYAETPQTVPDGGATVALLGLALSGLGLLRRRS